MSLGADRRERLSAARLYLVTDAGMAPATVRAALRGGVDMVQLRDPSLSDSQLLEAAAWMRVACEETRALLWVNDRPDLALAAGADGVHVGQADESVASVRQRVGEDVLIGLSTHAPDQLEAGIGSGADQLSVGPVWETPTKPGRRATGLAYVRHVAHRRPPVPWFAIGGIDEGNVHDVAEAGAERAVVVRALRHADDPEAAAARLRAALGRSPVGAPR